MLPFYIPKGRYTPILILAENFSWELSLTEISW